MRCVIYIMLVNQNIDVRIVIDKRVVVNREEVLCDLDRVRTSISSSDIGIIPSNIKIIRDKYVSGLRKIKHFDSRFEIDDSAVKILEQDEVVIQSDIKPMRYITFYFVLFVLFLHFSKDSALRGIRN